MSQGQNGGPMDGDSVSAEIADWSREKPSGFWDPSKKLLLSIRQYQKFRSHGLLGRTLCKFIVIRYRFWSIVTGADIPLTCNIGGGLLMPHPNGIVIHSDTKIGVNCLIFQQVTIGTRRGGGVPTIEGHVDIGAGAKIFGNVQIPAHSVVKANSVVTKWEE